ncbi:hypothetical protein VTI74DRAFT_2871 [Chaetomium olivicolor]
MNGPVVEVVIVEVCADLLAFFCRNSSLRRQPGAGRAGNQGLVVGGRVDLDLGQGGFLILSNSLLLEFFHQVVPGQGLDASYTTVVEVWVFALNAFQRSPSIGFVGHLEGSKALAANSSQFAVKLVSRVDSASLEILDDQVEGLLWVALFIVPAKALQVVPDSMTRDSCSDIVVNVKAVLEPLIAFSSRCRCRDIL